MQKRYSRHRPLFSTPMPKVVEKPKIKWKILSILWLAIKKTCMFIGAMVLISAVIAFWSVSSIVKDIDSPLPSQMVLYMELDGDLGDVPKTISISDPFAGTSKTLKTFIDSIERAKIDPRVEGVYARLNAGRYAISHIQEIRAAIKDFRSSGKFAYIYAPSYGNGLGSYYLAASFDEIWMQPMGSLMITGMNAEMPFLRGVLDKIGIEPQFFQRKEYKSAYESLTNSKMSDANRVSMKALVKDISDVLLADISSDRGVRVVDLKKQIDRGLLLSSEAVEAGLIDKVDYEDKLIDYIRDRVTGDPKSEDLIYVNFDSYMAEFYDQDNIFAVGSSTKDDKKKTSAPRVALIYAVGVIMDDNGQKSSMPLGISGGAVAAADEISEALLMAAYDDNIDAVVLRVDSPGGSPVASETILRAVEKVQEEGKSVTVSMGATAASGGYWISAYADQIFVLPSTITGSIGVLGGKVSVAELWKNLGVNWDKVSWGENSSMFSINTPFSKSEAERMNAMLDDIYDNFIARVSRGRKMDISAVDKIARGRVWVGTSAIKNGLADQFGGLNEALDYAAVKVGAENRNEIDVIILPKPLTPIEQFVKLIEGQVKTGKMLGIYAGVLEKIQPIISKMMIASDANNSVYNPVNIR